MVNDTLSLRRLNRATLARQMLLAREKIPAQRAIERLVGLQAQLPGPPFVGLWSRLAGFRREELHELIRRRRVVRATLMRATLHLMTAKDYVALRPAIQAGAARAMQSALRGRLDGLDRDAALAAARARLEKGPCTFDELRDHLAAAKIADDVRAIAYYIRTHLPLVQVAADAKWGYSGAVFALAESWLGAPLSPGDADPRALILRYLAAFGPATPGDAQQWSGAPKLREAFEALRPKLRVFRDQRGRELFDLPQASRPPEDVPAPVRFLPEYDNLLLSHDDRRRLLTDPHRRLVFLTAARVRATFLMDGFVAGAWRIERKKRAAALVVEPFSRLSAAARRDLAAEADKLLRFVEDDAEEYRVRFENPPA